MEWIEIIKIVGIYWVVVTWTIWFIWDSIKQKWWDFLKKESAESLEKKLFSFDEALNPKFITDKNGVISNINLSAEKLFHYKEKEVLNRNIEIIIPEKSRKYFSLTDDKEGLLMDVVSKSGSTIPAEIFIRKKAVKDDPFYIVIIRDRSKEVQTARKYEQLIEIMKMKNEILTKGEEIGGTGSWFWDIRTGEITASEGYRKIVGLQSSGRYKIEEIKPKIWEEDKDIVNEALEKAYKGQGYDITFRMIRATDFKVIFIRSIVEPYKDTDGVVIALYGSTRLLQTLNLKEAAK